MKPLEESLRKMMDEMIERTIFGPSRRQPETALVYGGNGFFVSREIGADGKLIEPCPYCGPVLLCSKHIGT